METGLVLKNHRKPTTELKLPMAIFLIAPYAENFGKGRKNHKSHHRGRLCSDRAKTIKFRVIIAVNERKNNIIRKSTNLSRESAHIAANLDQAVLGYYHDFPETQLGFIDRYLVTKPKHTLFRQF
jgi:putative ribosome biogenesis GTPase RsgA